MEGRINATHLKNLKLAAIKDLQTYNQYILVFLLLILNDGVGEALKQATSQTRENEDIIVGTAVKIVE